MKKLLIVIGILLIIFCGFIGYDTFFNEKIPVLSVEDEEVEINSLYVYGTYLNMEGSYNFLDKGELVLYNGEFKEYDLNYIDNNGVGKIFNLSDYINRGIYLDDIEIGDYYLFLRVEDEENSSDEEKKYRYYRLTNKTDYEETTYYTISKENKKIIIENDDSYPTMMLKVMENKDDNIYDIVIDPGHGGMDGGASKNGYKETDFTMNIATKLKKKLEEEGFLVKLTYEDGQLSEDEKLNEYGVNGRAVVPYEVKAKYLISLHLNSSNSSSVSGIEVYTAKNINYDLAKSLVENITRETEIGCSNNKINKVFDGIYSRNFTQKEIDEAIDEYKNKDLIPYDKTTKSNYYYMIRETGGIATGAYVDNRNSEIIGNPYVLSNVGTEAYLLELGYLSNKDDLNRMINDMDKYVQGIVISMKLLLNK